MISKAEMMNIVFNQLAIDYNCTVEDFYKDSVIITKAVKQEGRRKLPFLSPRCEVITVGNSAVVNASPDVFSFVQKRLKDKSRYDAMNASFVYGVCPYFLPDIDHFKPMDCDAFDFSVIEQNDIHSFYKYKGLTNALQYNENSLTPETLAVAAFKNGSFAGIACVMKDSEKMCQIGVDVLPEYRQQGLATVMVNKLTLEVLKRGLIPYYFTDNSNLASQKTAIRAGYFPAWSHCFKNRLFKKPFSLLNYLKY